MKKIITILSSVVLIGMVISSMVYLQHQNSNKYYEFLTFKKHYSYVMTNEQDHIEIPIFISKKNTMYTEADAIESVYISSNSEDIGYSLRLRSIVYNKETYQQGLTTFHQYTLAFSLDFDSSLLDVIKVKDATLLIKYTNEERLSLPVGYFSILKAQKLGTVGSESNHFRVTNIKGIINQVDEIQTLVGIMIRIQSNIDQNIKITEIVPISTSVEINYELTKVNEEDYYYNTLANEIFGDRFDIFNKGAMESTNIIIGSNESRISLPIAYTDGIMHINELGFIIRYEIDSVEYEFIYGTFKFFETSKNYIEIVKVIYERS